LVYELQAPVEFLKKSQVLLFLQAPFANPYNFPAAILKI
jgi:hypothetical protein